MVKAEKQLRAEFKKHIKADVIVLGCTLPGIVTAHNLKQKFGESMDIVVLDLGHSGRIKHSTSVAAVAFKGIPTLTFDDDEDEDLEMEDQVAPATPTATEIENSDKVARFFIEKYAHEFKLPKVLDLRQNIDPCLNKLFQYRNGSTVNCSKNFHEFDYLNFIERFELLQYQNLLDHSMLSLFNKSAVNNKSERKNALYYDGTSMEEHICSKLMLQTTREIMRTIVGLVCGTSADKASVLFYLHQCYRTNGSKNHIDGDNARLREKLVGSFRRRLKNTLKASVADITMESTPIKEIRTTRDERVILEPVKGETDYRCNLLAMALRPDQLRKIQVEAKLLAEKDREMAAALRPTLALKFTIQYERNFWRQRGYSGDILSIRGPILWAMERPKVTMTRREDKYAALVGFLKATYKGLYNKKAVVAQLVKLFGEEAANPVSYRETQIEDVYVPRRGDYVALRSLTADHCPRFLVWAAMDIFADGDVAGAVEAGHNAYLHLLSILRPQAISFEDVSSTEWPTNYPATTDLLLANINYYSTSRLVMYGVALGIGIHLIKILLKK